jgi:hypothetical protein
MKAFSLAVTAAALLGLAACGGSGGGAAAGAGAGAGVPGLSYVNPANAQGGFALVLDAAASDGSSLVLDLVGPGSSQATPAVGVTFGFNLDTTRAAWAATPVANGSLFTLGTGVQLAQGWVNGASLQGIVSNKGLGNLVADIGSGRGVIARISLAPVPGAAAGPVSLVDNGLGSVLDSSGTPYAIQVQVGTLTLN